jgi:uncharacterized protein YecE (DUF72 family)
MGKALETFPDEQESGFESSLKIDLFVGVSGFSYPGWKGEFYPKDLKSEDFLGYYSRKLNSVEINSSFYAPPTVATIKSWAGKTREDFRFSVKSPRQITHILKLGPGSTESAQRLGKTLEQLASKQGPILFQLPPFSKQDLKLLESFLEGSSSLKLRVFEFRHESWLDDSTYQLLEKHGAGICVAETEDMAPVLRRIGEFAYVRLRKDSYDAKSIGEWSKRIADLVKDSKEAYVYLRHDETGKNASHAVRLRELIEKAI